MFRNDKLFKIYIVIIGRAWQHQAQCDVNLLFHLYEATQVKNAKRASTGSRDYRNKQFSMEWNSMYST